MAAWNRFSRDVAEAERAVEASEGGMAFAFVEGTLVKAVREGWWLLLDEVREVALASVSHTCRGREGAVSGRGSAPEQTTVSYADQPGSC